MAKHETAAGLVAALGLMVASPAEARSGIEILSRDNYTVTFLQSSSGKVRYCTFYFSSGRISCNEYV